MQKIILVGEIQQNLGVCLRRISSKFAIIFGIEFFVLIVIVVSIFLAVKEMSEIVRILSSLSFSFGSLLLTTGLVYDHFLLHPELRIMNIVVEPLDMNLQQLAETEYRSPVVESKGWAHHDKCLKDNIIPKEKNGLKIVNSTSPCSKIRVSTDVCNIGGSETTIHEYIVREVQPNKRPETYIFRKPLQNEKRETIDFTYPATSGECEFEITVVASTQKKSRRVKVVVSDDLRTIKWQEYD